MSRRRAPWVATTLVAAGVAAGAGCASALPPPDPDSPLLGRPAAAPDPEAAAALRERAADAFAGRPDPDAVRASVDLAIRAALADPDDVEAVVLATRGWVWLASHAGDDRQAGGEAARQAVETARACRRRQPDHDACDYWLALAVGVQADLRRDTALDGVRVMVRLLRAAIASVPELDHAGPERVLARVLVQAPGWPSGPGDPDAGVEHARSAVERAPDWAPNWLALGEALREVGNPSGARTRYARALELARSAAGDGHPDAPEWIEEAEAALAALG